MNNMKSYIRNVKWTETRVYNNGLPMFAFLSKKGEQCNTMYSCKDYLHDITFLAINYPNGQYSKICSTQMRMIVSYNSIGEINVEQTIPMLHEIEDLFKIKHTFVRQIPNPMQQFINNSFIYFGDEAWMKAPFMISLYSLLIRLGIDNKEKYKVMDLLDKISTKKIVPSYYGDVPIVCSAIKGIKRLINEGIYNIISPNIKDNYPNMSSTHSTFGIAAFSDGVSAGYVPKWYNEVKVSISEKPNE